MPALDHINRDGTIYEIVPEIAPLFNTSTSYAVGDCVIKDAVLYRFKTAHSAGAWNSSEVDAINLGEEVTALKQDYNTLSAEVGDIGMYTLGLYPQKSVADVAVASFADGADDIPVKVLTVDVTPVQDLHGQANPYPDGGGKNLIPMTVAGIKALNTNGTWTGNSYSYAGITYVVDVDDGGNVSAIRASGTSTGSYAYFYLTNAFNAMANVEYIISGSPNGKSASTWRLWVDSTNAFPSGNRLSDGVAIDERRTALANETCVIYIQIFSGNTINGTFYPMIRKSTDSEGFAPYSNICPISGWTGANVSVFDVNVWDEVWENGIYSPTTGEPLSDSNYIRSKNKIAVISGTEYYVKKPSSAGFRVLYYDNSDAFISSETVADSWTGKAVTIPSNAKYVRIYCGTSTYNHDISINYPSTDHDYHAYKGGVYSVDWTTEAGTVYGGTLDVTSGVLTVDKGFYTLTGSETWTAWGSNAYYSVCLPSFTVINSLSINCISSMLVGNTTDAIYLGGSGIGARGKNLYVNASEYANIGTYTGMQVVYELATPVTYQLTPTEVITLLKNNNIFADTGNVAELTYRADLKAYIDEKLA